MLALNLAKARFHRGGLRFAPDAEVRAVLGAVAGLPRAEEIDLLFLSEVVVEGGPSRVDQMRELAESAGFHAWGFGECYSFGVPWMRVRAGNALLSRPPLRAVGTVQLAGGTPFWRPTNNRRLLLCEVELGGRSWLAGSVRNDSFDLANNARQTEQILGLLRARGDPPALLAGDFNAEPGSRSIELLRTSGRFSGALDGPPTFPARPPRRRIDYALAPSSWELLDDRVVDTGVPVLARFRLPVAPGGGR